MELRKLKKLQKMKMENLKKSIDLTLMEINFLQKITLNVVNKNKNAKNLLNKGNKILKRMLL